MVTMEIHGPPHTPKKNTAVFLGVFQVGLWKTSFDDYGQTSYAATAVVQLLVEELLGYNTRETGIGPADETCVTWEKLRMSVAEEAELILSCS